MANENDFRLSMTLRGTGNPLQTSEYMYLMGLKH